MHVVWNFCATRRERDVRHSGALMPRYGPATTSRRRLRWVLAAIGAARMWCPCLPHHARSSHVVVGGSDFNHHYTSSPLFVSTKKPSRQRYRYRAPHRPPHWVWPPRGVAVDPLMQVHGWSLDVSCLGSSQRGVPIGRHQLAPELIAIRHLHHSYVLNHVLNRTPTFGTVPRTPRQADEVCTPHGWVRPDPRHGAQPTGCAWERLTAPLARRNKKADNPPPLLLRGAPARASCV